MNNFLNEYPFMSMKETPAGNFEVQFSFEGREYKGTLIKQLTDQEKEIQDLRARVTQLEAQLEQDVKSIDEPETPTE